MPSRRITPEDDVVRLSERIYNFSGRTIGDRSSFDTAFDQYLDAGLTGKQDRQLRLEVFSEIRRNHPQVAQENIFRQAGGVNLKRDQRSTHRRVVRSKKEFIKIGAQKSDLRGLDTRTVFARKTTIRRGREQLVMWRDARGRFVSLKPRKRLRKK